LVEGRSNRRYTDVVAVVEAVSAAGFEPYEHKVQRKPKVAEIINSMSELAIANEGNLHGANNVEKQTNQC